MVAQNQEIFTSDTNKTSDTSDTSDIKRHQTKLVVAPRPHTNYATPLCITSPGEHLFDKGPCLRHTIYIYIYLNKSIYSDVYCVAGAMSDAARLQDTIRQCQTDAARPQADTIRQTLQGSHSSLTGFNHP